MEGKPRGEGAPLASTRAIKMPPPEKPDAIRMRSHVVLSFWVVILLLGIPMWWQTTSIYRARLPFEEMLHWADGSNGHPNFPLQIWISAPSMPCIDARRIIHETQQILDDLNEFPILHQRLRYVESADAGIRKPLGKKGQCAPDPVYMDEPEPALRIELVAGNQFAFRMPKASTQTAIQYSANAIASLPAQLADFLRGLFAEEQISIAHLYTVHAQANSNAQAFLRTVHGDAVAEVARRDARAFKHSPNYHLTFSLFTAGGSPSSWEIEAALNQYIRPLLHTLSSSSNFSITTQVQLYSSFSPSIQPLTHESLNGTFLLQDHLSAFVNAAEWPLSPSIGSGPTLNFIVYVPEKDQIPLSIYGSDTPSWLIPQWGGITIINPPLDARPETSIQFVPLHLGRELLEPAFEMFSSQLLSLLGVPSTHYNGGLLTLPLRLQTHQRLTALSLYLRACSSLGSLARLAQRLSNIPIPKHVAQLVDNAMAHLTASSQQLRDGYWDEALIHAKMAYEDSEKAFFDKSMVGQVYFPDEHKVAVYLPLLGPIGVPLMVGLLREVKRFASGLKARRS